MMKNKKGFTLIELVIVIAVVAILAAVLIPTFAGIITRANDGKKLEQAVSARNSYFSGNEEMSSIEDMSGYLISVDKANYIVLANGELGEIDDLGAFKADNDLDFELVEENTAATIYKPVEVLPVDPYTPGTFDSEGNFEPWEDIVEEGKLIIEGTTIVGVSGNLVTDNLVVGHEITAIGANAFKNNTGIKKITLSENITSIGDFGFQNSNIEEIDFNGAQITRIGEETFWSCDKLTEIVLPDTLEYIGRYGISYCYKLERVVLPASLKTLDYGALMNNKLTEIILPEGLEYIGPMAFVMNENVHELVIPESVTYIGYNALDLYRQMDSSMLKDNPVYTIRFNFTEATQNVSRSISWYAIDSSYIVAPVDEYFMELEMEEHERQWCEENGYEYYGREIEPLTGSITVIIEFPQNDYGESYCSGLNNLVDDLRYYDMYGHGDYNVSDYVSIIVRDVQD